jgi:rhodanese-related sulfurtransferase
MQVLPSAFNGIPTIDPELLLQELRSGRSMTILDVRDAESFQHLGWIAGARHIPMRELLGRRAELRGLEGERILVVSARGTSAHDAAVALNLAGFGDVASLAGGMARWLSLGFPVVHAQKMPPPARHA